MTAVRVAPHRGDAGPGRILSLVISGQARTRTAISEVTGLSRPTVSQRLEVLFDAGLLVESEEILPSGGRPARVLEFHARRAVVVCADVGEKRSRIALADLQGKTLADDVQVLPLSDGPTVVLDRIIDAARELLHDAGLPDGRVAGVGLSLPAPIDFGTGSTAGWSVLSGWAGFDVREHLRQAFDVPVLVDNDVNLLTLAEHRLFWPKESHLLYVKAGTGIGSGIISDQKLNRGALGAAGDIGHTRLSGYGDPRCRCGNRGCVESLAGGWALARRLTADGAAPVPVRDARDVVRLVRQGNASAIALVRDAGRILGEAVAFATSLLNPAVIVVGGSLSGAGDHLLAGVREIVYQRSLPLATHQLQITGSRLDHYGGLIGAALLVVDAILEPAAIDAALATGDLSGWAIER